MSEATRRASVEEDETNTEKMGLREGDEGR